MYYIGIDIAKHNHEVSIIDADGKSLSKSISIANSQKGLDDFNNYLSSFNVTSQNSIIGMESTRHYWLNLYSALVNLNFNVFVINPIQTDAFRKMYIRKTKNDSKDSYIIAQIMCLVEFSSSTISDENIFAIRQLSRYRSSLVDECSSWKRKVITILDQVFPEYSDLFSDTFGITSKELLSKYPLPENMLEVSTKELTSLLNKASKGRFGIEKAQSYAERLNKYANYLEILGERNSFSKTDKEATFMRMKEDYMRNGQLKPGYNLQIGVISEYIVSYDIFHNPSDTKTLIPFLEKIKSQNIEVKNVVADAGYESLSNYEYLKINNYVSYIKPIYYEKSKTRKYKKDLNRVENLEYNEEENRLFRKDGLELEFLYYGKDKKTIYFRNPETEKKVRYNYEFRKLSKESKDNIESEFGKQLRMNRSIQVEGAFAVIKEDMKLRKLKVRGKNSVKREIALFCIAYNFNRYISKLSKNKIGIVLHSLKSA